MTTVFTAYPLAQGAAEVAATAGLGPVTVIAAATALAFYDLYQALAPGFHKDVPPHTDPGSGIAEDDEDHDGDYPDGGKGIEPQPGGKGIPAQTHSSHQDAYVGQSNEKSSDYWHYFNIICRKFYNRHRRMAVSHPEKYAMALFYFLRRHRRVPRRVINRSALIEGPRDYHMDWTMMKNHPVARRARGRVFLAS